MGISLNNFRYLHLFKIKRYVEQLPPSHIETSKFASHIGMGRRT